MTYGGLRLKIELDLLRAAVLDRRPLSRTRFFAGFLHLKDVQSSWLETCPTSQRRLIRNLDFGRRSSSRVRATAGGMAADGSISGDTVPGNAAASRTPRGD